MAGGGLTRGFFPTTTRARVRGYIEAGGENMGRKRKYTGKTLRREVERYFKSISMSHAAMTESGAVIFNDLGDTVQVISYVIPPTVSGLCRYLGIDRHTWVNYQDEKQYPELQPAVQMARDRMEEYLEIELLTREKNVRGVIFNLQNNYGWRQKVETELGRETRKAMAAESMSIEEKLRYIAEMQAEIAAGAEEPAGN